MNQDKALGRLWGTGSIRVFVSHNAESKELATSLKDCLSHYGVACFVAHEDIEPTREWQGEIERALFSMHILVPLLTEKFHESNWTDQEIGVAVGQEVPIISIRRGKDPYGFIGKYQAMQGKDKDPEQIAEEFFGLLFKQDELKELATNTFITTVAGVGNWGRANSLAKGIIYNRTQPLSGCLSSLVNRQLPVHGRLCLTEVPLPDPFVFLALKDRIDAGRAVPVMSEYPSGQCRLC